MMMKPLKVKLTKSERTTKKLTNRKANVKPNGNGNVKTQLMASK